MRVIYMKSLVRYDDNATLVLPQAVFDMDDGVASQQMIIKGQSDARIFSMNFSRQFEQQNCDPPQSDNTVYLRIRTTVNG